MIVRHLYVHVPFCHRICPYCAFYKHQPGETSTAAVVDALLAELDRHRERFEILPETIYFGGGTPTLLGANVLATLLEGFHQRLPMADLKEWTMEANPKTFDAKKAALMRTHGVTRVSLGVQSWNQLHLATLGRDHSPEEAEASYHLLREAEIPFVNVDLMFSLPNQSLIDWRVDLEKTVSLRPDHVSAYNLTYEEDTPFFDQLGRGAFRDEEDNNADHFYLADQLLTKAGYRHYEISNYARSGAESKHNRAYWAGNDYLGLGPSAVSTVDGKRWRNVPDTALYARGNPHILIDEEILSENDCHNERVALSLRTLEGIPAVQLADAARQRATELADEGVLEFINHRFRLTPGHRALVDPVAADLFV